VDAGLLALQEPGDLAPRIERGLGLYDKDSEVSLGVLPASGDGITVEELSRERV
jgi:hypothetical protein